MTHKETKQKQQKQCSFSSTLLYILHKLDSEKAPSDFKIIFFENPPPNENKYRYNYQKYALNNQEYNHSLQTNNPFFSFFLYKKS